MTTDPPSAPLPLHGSASLDNPKSHLKNDLDVRLSNRFDGSESNLRKLELREGSVHYSLERDGRKVLLPSLLTPKIVLDVLAAEETP